VQTVDVRPPPDAVRVQLGRLLASDGFSNADRMSRFLRYVVERTLAGEADQLKEYAIGLDVFDRKETYDPRLDSIVRVEAARLRSKVEEYYNRAGLDDPIVIRLRRGSYIPVFEERAIAPASAPGVANSPNAPASEKRRWHLKAALVAVAVILLVAAGWRAWSSTSAPAAPAVRVAVLPLTRYSNEQADEILAARLTDGVTSELARFPALAVVSHTSALQFAGARRPLREIAQALDAAVIVEGSVVAKGDGIRVSARLVDGATDRKIWVQDFDAPTSDLAALQREIAKAVATAIASRPFPGT
jgi:TolB-like protein